MKSARSCFTIVVHPLKSIIKSIVKVKRVQFISSGIGYGAKEIGCYRNESGNYQLVYASAEQVFNPKFVDLLKNSDSTFSKALSLVVVDESVIPFTHGMYNCSDCL